MLQDSLPQFVREMKEMALILGVDQIEINRMEMYIEEMLQQFWISTSTYSIDDWEREFGIEKNHTLTLGQRRAQILAKLNTRPPSTVKMIENLVIKVLGENRVEVVENYQDYSFTIIIRSDHVLENMMVANDAVYNARPAHLNYAFINRIVRESMTQLYIVSIGRKCKVNTAEVDTRRRYRSLYLGSLDRTIRTTKGDVEIK